MISAARSNQILDENNIPVQGALVYVYDVFGDLAALTSNGTTSIPNPLTTDQFGNYAYQALVAYYNEDIWYGGRRQWRENNVALGSPGADLALRTDVAASTGAALIGANDGSSGSLFTTVAGFIAKLLSSAGSSVIGFIQSGTGAVSRSLQSILRDRAVSVVSYGAVLDGVTDNSVAIQNALNSGAASVFIPAGSCAWTSVSVPAKVKFGGLGRLSVAVPLANTGNFITFSGGETELHDLTIAAATQRSGGTYVNIPQFDVRVSRVKFSNGFNIINIPNGGGAVILDTLNLRDNNNGGGSELITVNTTASDIVINKVLADNSGAQPSAGIKVLAVGDLTITDSNLIHCGTDLLVAPPTSSAVASIYAANTFFDTATKGISIKPTGGTVIRCHFENVWGSSHTSHGIEIDGSGGTVNGVTFVDPQVNLNGGDGIHLVGSLNIKIIGGEAAQNVGSGFSADATATKFVVREFTAGAVEGLTGNAYGINIAAGASDFDADDNFCSGNTTADIVGVVATLASATTLPIPTRGKKFNVTGTTGITGMTAFAGRRVSLFFAGVLTVTSGTGSATSIRLASGSNFTTAAGSSLTLEHNGTQWYEVGRAA